MMRRISSQKQAAVFKHDEDEEHNHLSKKTPVEESKSPIRSNSAPNLEEEYEEYDEEEEEEEE